MALYSCNTLAITCSNPKRECIEPGSTKYFDGVPVTLDCWKYKDTYECKESNINDNCQKLKEKGRSPVAAICKSMWGDACAVQEVTYDCPKQKCDGADTVCGSSRGFCMSGDCASQERSKDQDMKQALAALSGAAEAAKLIDKSDVNNLKIFTGKSSECSKNIASGITKNCCNISPTGFLEGKVLECDDEERELARAKVEGRVIGLGEYCHNKVLGVCTSYHQTYCVFGSKLARILQEAGRSQLGVSLGGPESPNCRGLSPEEFQKIDFSKIDFSDFYQDIMSTPKQSLAELTANTQKIATDAKRHAEDINRRTKDTKDSIEKIREKMQSKMRNSHEQSELRVEANIRSRDK